MSLNAMFSYYGRMDGPARPLRSLVDDLVKEKEVLMLIEMKEMEDRLKRHVTECKREVIKELNAIFNIEEPKSKTTKEQKYVGKSKTK